MNSRRLGLEIVRKWHCCMYAQTLRVIMKARMSPSLHSSSSVNLLRVRYFLLLLFLNQT
jgi:hypothetical protein